MVLTIRFDCRAEHLPALRGAVLGAAQEPRITGAHLCIGDTEASAVRTAETRDRTDIHVPPKMFIMAEATDAEALANILPDASLIRTGAHGPFVRGIYRLEYVRTKTAFAS